MPVGQFVPKWRELRLCQKATPGAQRMSEVLKHMEYEAKHKVKLKLLYLIKNENIVSLTH